MKLEAIWRDVVIVGGGPAGLAAAQAAAGRGASVLLVDDNPLAGGQVWRASRKEIPAAEYIASLHGHGVEVWSATRVVATPGAQQLLLEDSTRTIHLRYGRLVLANGARERFLPFPGWTLPGVTGAGGLQALVKGGLDVRGQRVVLAGTGPLLLAAARTLVQAGADVMRIAEQTPPRELRRFAAQLWRYPAKLWQAAGLRWALRGVPYVAGSHVVAAHGESRLQSARIRLAGEIVDVACDWLGVGYHLLPNTELAVQLGCALRGDAVAVDARQQTSQPGILAAGEVTGVGGLDKAWLEGQIAGFTAVGAYAEADALAMNLPRQHRFAALLQRHFALQPAVTQLADAETLICRCEDVSHAALQAFDNWREAKLQTRCGMGACQGRICGSICQTLYGWPDRGARPPLQPARLATLAGLNSPTTLRPKEDATS